MTHEARLRDCETRLAEFRREIAPLGGKLGAVLVQLPPSLILDLDVAEAFFAALRGLDPETPVACEPRHASWFDETAEHLLARHRVVRVAADPARHPLAGEPGGWRGFEYHRLHGSPRMYYSAYSPEALTALATRLRGAPSGSWCIFDNTTSGAAAADALALRDLLATP